MKKKFELEDLPFFNLLGLKDKKLTDEQRAGKALLDLANKFKKQEYKE